MTQLRCRFLTPDTKAIGFTDGKVYKALAPDGRDELRVREVINDSGRKRVVIPGDPSDAFCDEKVVDRYFGQRLGKIVFEEVPA